MTSSKYDVAGKQQMRHRPDEVRSSGYKKKIKNHLEI